MQYVVSIDPIKCEDNLISVGFLAASGRERPQTATMSIAAGVFMVTACGKAVTAILYLRFPYLRVVLLNMAMTMQP